MKKKNRKKVANPNLPSNRKQAIAIEDPNKGRDLPIVWKFHKMVLNKEKPWNWCQLEESGKITEIFKKLGKLELSTFNELVSDRKHHHISIEKFKERNVQKELKRLGILDIGALFSLRLDGETRVYCITYSNHFNLLWYDPNHEVYPSEKKGT